jgi:hypothetical protein
MERTHVKTRLMFNYIAMIFGAWASGSVSMLQTSNESVFMTGESGSSLDTATSIHELKHAHHDAMQLEPIIEEIPPIPHEIDLHRALMGSSAESSNVDSTPRLTSSTITMLHDAKMQPDTD